MKKALIKTLPVMAGYIVLGIGFGILLNRAGFGVWYALAMGLLIYAGSMQYVGVSLLAGGASLITVALTTFMVNARKYFENDKGTEPFLPYYKFNGSDLTTFKFTNKAGSETATLISFLDGTRSFPDDGEGVIIFKDPTFGGIFPDFEQKDVWELIDKLGSIKIKFWDRDDYSTGGTTYEEYNCFYRDDNANTYYSYGECVANAYGECHEFCD